ncbi:SoxR reducing system RseC family protein [Thalassobellus suaedae]|uniref:SoxR reducing system RseC family protein n=1 Tax=Thalassobellus suaedae TaxID=3074124 RepID=A0ABY9XQW2_9FLAO|nr:SoxR reducing system RseC family protein [Flavobacteriaceae bacterium HL-DH14]
MNSQPSNKNTFIHAGIVTKIGDESVVVSLEQNIHCESCRAKAACGISESNTKEIEIINPNDSYKINEHVNVVLKKALGFKAVFWAYVFPFILMFLTLIIASIYLKEWIAGILSLLILIPYYLTLYFLKSKLKSAFKISILKI